MTSAKQGGGESGDINSSIGCRFYKEGKVLRLRGKTPSITVTVRVPAHVFEQLERKLTIMRENGINVSKNSLFVEALKKYLESSELKDKGK